MDFRPTEQTTAHVASFNALHTGFTAYNSTPHAHEHTAHRTPARPPAPGAALRDRLKRAGADERQTSGPRAFEMNTAITVDVEALTKFSASALAQRVFPDLYKADSENAPAHLKQHHAAVIGQLQAANWGIVVSICLVAASVACWLLMPHLAQPSGGGWVVVAGRLLECTLVLVFAHKKPFLYRSHSHHLSLLLTLNDVLLSGSFLSAMLGSSTQALTALLAAFLLLPGVAPGHGSGKEVASGVWGGLRHRLLVSTTYMTLIPGFVQLAYRFLALPAQQGLATPSLVLAGVLVIAVDTVARCTWPSICQLYDSLHPATLAMAVASAGKRQGDVDQQLYKTLLVHFQVAALFLVMMVLGSLAIVPKVFVTWLDLVLMIMLCMIRLVLCSFFLAAPWLNPAWYYEHLSTATAAVNWTDSFLTAVFLPLWMPDRSFVRSIACHSTIPVMKMLQCPTSPYHWMYPIGLFVNTTAGTLISKLLWPDVDRFNYTTSVWLGQGVALVMGFVLRKEEDQLMRALLDPWTTLRAGARLLRGVDTSAFGPLALAACLTSLVAPLHSAKSSPPSAEGATQQSKAGPETPAAEPAKPEWKPDWSPKWDPRPVVKAADPVKPDWSQELKPAWDLQPAMLAMGAAKPALKPPAKATTEPNWLCEEVMIPVFDRMAAKDLLMAEAVCKDWNVIVNTHNVWRELCIRRYGRRHVLRIQSMLAQSRHVSWKQLYQRCQRLVPRPLLALEQTELVLVADMFVGTELVFTAASRLSTCLGDTEEFDAVVANLDSGSAGRTALRQAVQLRQAATDLERQYFGPGMPIPVADMAAAPLQGMLWLVRPSDGTMVELVSSTAFMRDVNKPWQAHTTRPGTTVLFEPVNEDYPLPDHCQAVLARDGSKAAQGKMWSLQFVNDAYWCHRRNDLSKDELLLSQMLDFRMTVFFEEEKERGGAVRMDPKLLSLTVADRDENHKPITCTDMLQWYLPHAFRGQEPTRTRNIYSRARHQG